MTRASLAAKIFVSTLREIYLKSQKAETEFLSLPPRSLRLRVMPLFSSKHEPHAEAQGTQSECEVECGLDQRTRNLSIRHSCLPTRTSISR